MDYMSDQQTRCKQALPAIFTALGGFSMHVPKGAIYGFVGKNGAGKNDADPADLRTAGAHLRQLLPVRRGITPKPGHSQNHRRRMGAVVETPSIYLDMTAEDNLKRAVPDSSGLPSFDGIAELAAHWWGWLTHGRKEGQEFFSGHAAAPRHRRRSGRRIRIFLCWMSPMNGLDPQGIIEVRELILKLNREHRHHCSDIQPHPRRTGKACHPLRIY